MTFHKVWDPTFFTLFYQTVYVAVISTVIILILAVIVANVSRTHSTFSFFLSKSVTTGYSIPGPIIAIGVLAMFIYLDQWLAPVYSLWVWGSTSYLKFIFDYVNRWLFYSFYGYGI